MTLSASPLYSGRGSSDGAIVLPLDVAGDSSANRLACASVIFKPLAFKTFSAWAGVMNFSVTVSAFLSFNDRNRLAAFFSSVQPVLLARLGTSLKP